MLTFKTHIECLPVIENLLLQGHNIIQILTPIGCQKLIFGALILSALDRWPALLVIHKSLYPLAQSIIRTLLIDIKSSPFECNGLLPDTAIVITDLETIKLQTNNAVVEKFKTILFIGESHINKSLWKAIHEHGGFKTDTEKISISLLSTRFRDSFELRLFKFEDK